VADDRIFCSIAAGDVPAHVYRRGRPHTIAFLDINPGHIIPCRHAKNLYETI
jgi:diadenosine tetraphosphate (Ap4A) HIT family hydrolase